jgi:hypothetical protein
MSMPCDFRACEPHNCTDEECVSNALFIKPITSCSREEQEAYTRGMISSLNPTFNIPDMNKRTNNTFINRYLEMRGPRKPKKYKFLACKDCVRHLCNHQIHEPCINCKNGSNKG